METTQVAAAKGPMSAPPAAKRARTEAPVDVSKLSPAEANRKGHQIAKTVLRRFLPLGLRRVNQRLYKLDQALQQAELSEEKRKTLLLQKALCEGAREEYLSRLGHHRMLP